MQCFSQKAEGYGDSPPKAEVTCLQGTLRIFCMVGSFNMFAGISFTAENKIWRHHYKLHNSLSSLLHFILAVGPPMQISAVKVLNLPTGRLTALKSLILTSTPRGAGQLIPLPVVLSEEVVRNYIIIPCTPGLPKPCPLYSRNHVPCTLEIMYPVFSKPCTPYSRNHVPCTPSWKLCTQYLRYHVLSSEIWQRSGITPITRKN